MQIEMCVLVCVRVLVSVVIKWNFMDVLNRIEWMFVMWLGSKGAAAAERPLRAALLNAINYAASVLFFIWSLCNTFRASARKYAMQFAICQQR